MSSLDSYGYGYFCFVCLGSLSLSAETRVVVGNAFWIIFVSFEPVALPSLVQGNGLWQCLLLAQQSWRGADVGDQYLESSVPPCSPRSGLIVRSIYSENPTLISIDSMSQFKHRSYVRYMQTASLQLPLSRVNSYHKSTCWIIASLLDVFSLFSSIVLYRIRSQTCAPCNPDIASPQWKNMIITATRH